MQVLPLQALGDPVAKAPGRHRHHAVAAIGGMTGDRGDDLVGDLDPAQVLLLHNAVQVASELLVKVGIVGSRMRSGPVPAHVRIPTDLKGYANSREVAELCHSSAQSAAKVR